MPVTCIVVGCGSRGDRDLVSFYSLPAILNHKYRTDLNQLSKERREKWLAAIRREDLTETKMKYQRVCNKHFITGKPAALEDKNNPDWIPTLKMGYETQLVAKSDVAVARFERVKKRKKLHDQIVVTPMQVEEAQHLQEEEEEAESGIHTQTELTYDYIEKMEQNTIFLNQKIQDLSRTLNKLSLTETSFQNNNEKTLFHTGLSYPLFNAILKIISPNLPSHPNNALNHFQQFLLTMMKLRLNLSFKDLSYRFAISISTASSTFEKTIDILYAKFKSLIIWPELEDRNKNIPSCFKNVFHDKTTVIVDCFEIFIQKPANLLTRKQCWSNYKHHYTIKFLIGITPQGTISYISNAWGGRISDKQIVQNSNFLNFINPHDIILADRGFLIKDMVGVLQAKVTIPAFTKGKNQLHPFEIEDTRHIAQVRIHVERIIGLIKNKFQFMNETMPITMLNNICNDISILDKIVTVCCALINLSPPIVPL